MDIEDILAQFYGMKLLEDKKFKTGAGSDTWYIRTDKGEYILKHPCESEINNPELECELCTFLNNHGVKASEFMINLEEQYITKLNRKIYHLQKYVEGTTYNLNAAPEWLLDSMAAELGRIHSVLKKYKPLPVGIGEDFFNYMTPANALGSYNNSLKIAYDIGDMEVVKDLEFRIKLMNDFPIEKINIQEFSCGNTHGDYFISQILAENNTINAVIDWTSACVHPYVWEIIRSFVYADPDCVEGNINSEKLKRYVDIYLKYNDLNDIDISRMRDLFFYQIAVCDYYGQYYGSDADNRAIYLNQAKFSTKLMKKML